MPKHGKKFTEAQKKIDPQQLYGPDEAITLLKDVAFANFDETVEVHARLSIDPRQADQTVRSTVVLPHGTGKTVRVLVFAAGEAERIARDAGADYAGTDDLVQQILGRRGLMPNPRSGTVVREAVDLPNVLRELKGGRVEFRNDRTGIVHLGIGRKSFSDEQIRDNLFAFVDALQRAKPTGAKGVYLRTLTITSTMAPGVPLDVALTTAAASETAA
jgi:large subunit ribosomal protein L1